jgi:heme exporter protein D
MMDRPRCAADMFSASMQVVAGLVVDAVRRKTNLLAAERRERFGQSKS